MRCGVGASGKPYLQARAFYKLAVQTHRNHCGAPRLWGDELHRRQWLVNSCDLYTASVSGKAGCDAVGLRGCAPQNV